MKVLIIKTYPQEIKVQNITYNHQEIGLARALIENGCQCDVMCTADQKPSVQTISLGNGKSITLYCMKAVKILKNGFFLNVDKIFEKYDILHVCEYNQLFTWHIAKKYREKMVCYHGPYYSAFNKRYNLMAQVFDFVFLSRYKKLNTRFLTKSNLATDYLKSKGLTNIRTIGVGIDIQALASASDDKLNFIEEINHHSEAKIMYIGRLEERRNPLFLLDLLAELNKKIEVSLILVGSGDDAFVRSFFQKVKQIGLQDHVIYRKRVEQKYMEQLYSCAEIFILPTIYDIYGMVLLEAMYFNQCVFTTVNGGSNMMIEDGENGYIFENFNVQEWSNKILNILKDEQKKKEIAQKAHKTIEEKYTWQKLASKFIDEYERKMIRRHKNG